MEKISTLNFAAGCWKTDDSSWDGILQRKRRPKGELIFAPLSTVAKAPDALRIRIMKVFELERALLSNVCLDSNGFSGCEHVCNDRGDITRYNIWCRFTVKQTLERLRPKRSFTQRSALMPQSAKAHVPIHDSRSIQHGWQWYEMSFFVQWTPSSTTILCFDLPPHLQVAVQEAVMSSADEVNLADPCSILATIISELLLVYDNSVWSIRNHISNWESARTEEPDYPLLHEIARHAIHVSETITVASNSLSELQKQHKEFVMLYSQGRPITRQWNCDRFNFPLAILNGLLSRSKSNEGRVQNETQLAFHTASQRDSRTQMRIAEEAQKEAKAMKAIAVITMTFLPATFVSSMFSTPFFHFEPSKSEIQNTFVISDQFWMYWAISVPLSLSILACWAFWDRVWIKKQDNPRSGADIV